MYYNVSLKRVRVCNVAGQKMSITCSDGLFVALGVQHAKRMRHIVRLYNIFHIIS